MASFGASLSPGRISEGGPPLDFGKLGNITSIISLEKDAYIGACFLCDKMETLCWQVTNSQDEHVDVCESCGLAAQKEFLKQ